ncbi:unnamed protein product [Candidula unifasciata]|uniref:Receptor ligand binding region domain-containing protein n=1 Tax=Candidula unifasciata TaxID=100452 RepID=A0A8S3YKT2_9EUPU|nr:unnamed protein product [Candidula unifasciata]
MGFSHIWKSHTWPKLVILTICAFCFTDMSMASEIGSRQDKKPINVLLLLPTDTKYMFTHALMFPALEIAMEKLESNDSLLRDYYLNVSYEDTMCHEAMGMKYAIEYYFVKLVDVFFGPICDYTVAPLLRQATFWNLPMVTVGANAWGFTKFRRTVFPMLTRVGPVNHYSLVNFFLEYVGRYNWTKVRLVSTLYL